MNALRDIVFRELHKAVGVCGHCGKKTCLGRDDHSVLPNSISTDTIIAAFDAAIAEAHKEGKG